MISCKLEDDDNEEEEEIEKIKNKEDKIEFTMFDYIWINCLIILVIAFIFRNCD